MKTSILTLLASTIITAMADSTPLACGHQLVNGGGKPQAPSFPSFSLSLRPSASMSMGNYQVALTRRAGWTQADIAKAACGRTDTCSGQEWNTLFKVKRMSSGPSEWTEIETTGVFCHKGCYGDVGIYNGQCH